MTKFRNFVAVFGLIALAGAAARAQPVGMAAPNAAVAGLHAEIKAEVAQVKANAKTSAVTREQIQQLRTALKVKLTAIRK